jgi:hypothetical protein
MANPLAGLSAEIAKVPAPVRHATLMLLASLVSWLVTSDPTGAFTTGVGAALLAWLTPLVQGYGLGKGTAQ